MALQVKQTNRRQFLGRSALGAGSLLFGPLLLESCTDHVIPDPKPDPTPTPPHVPSAESGTDWNEGAKKTIALGLKLVPVVGGFVSGLVDIFWPDSNGPAAQVRAQIEALIDQKIADDYYITVTGNLEGLRNVINDYKTAVDDYNNTPKIDPNKDYGIDLRNAWGNAYSDFDLYKPNFKHAGDEVLLLPLYAQFASLNLALLRDLVVFSDNGKYTGVNWGFSDTEMFTYIGRITTLIQEFTDWTTTWYTNGRNNIINNTHRNDRLNEPFTSVNKYDRTMTMLVLDYMDSWKYYDINQYPYGAGDLYGTPIPLFTREIYSDPYGNIYNPLNTPQPLVLPSPATQFPTKITVWAGHRIDAVQLEYPTGTGGGPGGADTTPRMGDQNGGSANTFTLAPGKFILATFLTIGAWYQGGNPPTPLDEYIGLLELVIGDNNGHPVGRVSMGADAGIIQSPIIEYDHYALSSVYIHGTNYNVGSADCIVFGFMRWPRG